MHYRFCLALLFALCSLDAFAQATGANPDVPADSCPYNIVFVLDESGSISGSVLTAVETGAKTLVAGVSGSGARMAVVEFSNAGRRASIGGTTAYQLVNSAYVVSFNNYINGAGASTNTATYSPGGGTNWQDAFIRVQNISSGAPPNDGLADLVIFFTDGDPTVDNGAGTPISNGIIAANAVKAQGSHIFVIALASSGISITRIEQISGTDRYTQTSVGSFLTYDYSLSSTFLTPQCR